MAKRLYPCKRTELEWFYYDCAICSGTGIYNKGGDLAHLNGKECPACHGRGTQRMECCKYHRAIWEKAQFDLEQEGKTMPVIMKVSND